MKRTIAALLALMLLLGLCACGETKDAASEEQNATIETAGEQSASQDNEKNDTPNDALKAAAVGDVIVFGAYEQDNDAENGKEAIEWIVLAKEDNKLLVLSKYVLDAKAFNDKQLEDTTWETSTLRSWLNREFLNEAFTAGEQGKIAATAVKAEKNPEYETEQGSDTEDKVFLLSIGESDRIFGSKEARKTVATAYAEAKGTEKSLLDEYACDFVLLRTAGRDSIWVAYANALGEIDCGGMYTTEGHGGVRPAMWIQT